MAEATTNIEKLIETYVTQIQDLEQVFFQLVNLRTIDTSEGVQLDGIGQIVGEDRFGRNDTDYRVAIKGRIRLNLSNGTIEDIIAVIRAQIGDKQVVVTEDSFPAHFDAIIPGVIDTLAAFVISGSTETYALTHLDDLDIVVDGGAPQNIIFDAADFEDITVATAAEVAAAIDVALAGGNAVIDFGRVLIRSDVLGDTSSIQVTGGLANAVLNFDTDLHTGEEANQDLMVRVSNTMQDARGAGIRGILFWSTCAASFGFAGTPGALGFGQGCFASALDV
jgi:hypothetical protein